MHSTWSNQRWNMGYSMLFRAKDGVWFKRSGGVVFFFREYLPLIIVRKFTWWSCRKNYILTWWSCALSSKRTDCSLNKPMYTIPLRKNKYVHTSDRKGFLLWADHCCRLTGCQSVLGFVWLSRWLTVWRPLDLTLHLYPLVRIRVIDTFRWKRWTTLSRAGRRRLRPCCRRRRRKRCCGLGCHLSSWEERLRSFCQTTWCPCWTPAWPSFIYPPSTSRIPTTAFISTMPSSRFEICFVCVCVCFRAWLIRADVFWFRHVYVCRTSWRHPYIYI